MEKRVPLRCLYTTPRQHSARSRLCKHQRFRNHLEAEHTKRSAHSLLEFAVPLGVSRSRKRPGDIPMIALKARLKAVSSP